MTAAAGERAPVTAPVAEGPLVRRARKVTGGLFLVTGGVHLGIVAAGTRFYEHFADRGLFAFVREGWADIFMAAPVFWGLCLMAGEIVLGTCLLAGGRWARFGWLGVIAFHLLLMLFGVGIWAWSLPALAVLVPLTVADWPFLTTRRS